MIDNATRVWLKLALALSLVTGNAISHGQQSGNSQPAKTTRESDKMALDSLLRSLDEWNCKKDAQGHVVSLALTLSNASDQNLRLVSTVSTLQELTIQGRGWPSNRWTLDGLAQLKPLTNLSMLHIGCLATDPDKNLQFLHEVSSLTQLNSLHLVGASQKTPEYFALTNLQNLTTLVVAYDTNFGNAELGLLTNLPNLKSVELVGLGVTPKGTNVLSQISSLTNVTIWFRK